MPKAMTGEPPEVWHPGRGAWSSVGPRGRPVAHVLRGERLMMRRNTRRKAAATASL